jgi:uncharacterized repeat protein (TIGR03803 family)
MNRLRKQATNFAQNKTRALALIMGLALVAACFAQGHTYSVLYNFGVTADGTVPLSSVIRDSTGNLYGTLEQGGTDHSGVVFKVDPSGTETVLHSFTGSPSDGGYPMGGLLMDKSGNLYGTTMFGGTSGNGVVFKIDSSGNESILHNFAGGTTDGCNPEGSLVADGSGNFYGTTDSCGVRNLGTIFKSSPTGKVTLLHSFAGAPTDGFQPGGGSTVLLGDGVLYGATIQGGTNNIGVVYKLSKSGMQILHNFTGFAGADGCFPNGTPVMDKEGNLYGTAEQCGVNGLGMIWKLSSIGTETVLYNFVSNSQGSGPLSGVILDPNGTIYGVASAGYGTVYELSPSGTYTVLHSFGTAGDGEFPYYVTPLLSDGALYGTTSAGGSDYGGTLWSISK